MKNTPKVSCPTPLSIRELLMRETLKFSKSHSSFFLPPLKLYMRKTLKFFQIPNFWHFFVRFRGVVFWFRCLVSFFAEFSQVLPRLKAWPRNVSKFHIFPHRSFPRREIPKFFSHISPFILAIFQVPVTMKQKTLRHYESSIFSNNSLLNNRVMHQTCTDTMYSFCMYYDNKARELQTQEEMVIVRSHERCRRCIEASAHGLFDGYINDPKGTQSLQSIQIRAPVHLPRSFQACNLHSIAIFFLKRTVLDATVILLSFRVIKRNFEWIRDFISVHQTYELEKLQWSTNLRTPFFPSQSRTFPPSETLLCERPWNFSFPTLPLH
jgi:hypothetical protein